MNEYTWAENEFLLYQKLVKEHLGITLADQKKALVANRLGKRLLSLNLDSFTAYHKLLTKNKKELQLAMDAITTNETFFFREQKHFDFMAENILPEVKMGQDFKVWSAASSIGQEAYSIAMLLDDKCHGNWSVLATDVNKQVLEEGRKAIYLDDRTELIPPEYLTRYCKKGTGPYEGYLRVCEELRHSVTFDYLNLMKPLHDIGMFDLVFLRNVMIYFDDDTKKDVLSRTVDTLKPGGYLFVGHSEALYGLNDTLVRISPAIYRRPKVD